MTLLGIVALGFLFLAAFGKRATAGALKVIGVFVLIVFSFMIITIISAQRKTTPEWMVEDTRPDPNWPGIPPPGHHFNKYGWIYPDDDHGGAAAR